MKDNQKKEKQENSELLRNEKEIITTASESIPDVIRFGITGPPKLSPKIIWII